MSHVVFDSFHLGTSHILSADIKLQFHVARRPDRWIYLLCCFHAPAAPRIVRPTSRVIALKCVIVASSPGLAGVDQLVLLLALFDDQSSGMCTGSSKPRGRAHCLLCCCRDILSE